MTTAIAVVHTCNQKIRKCQWVNDAKNVFDCSLQASVCEPRTPTIIQRCCIPLYFTSLFPHLPFLLHYPPPLLSFPPQKRDHRHIIFLSFSPTSPSPSSSRPLIHPFSTHRFNLSSPPPLPPRPLIHHFPSTALTPLPTSLPLHAHPLTPLPHLPLSLHVHLSTHFPPTALTVPLLSLYTQESSQAIDSTATFALRKNYGKTRQRSSQDRGKRPSSGRHFPFRESSSSLAPNHPPSLPPTTFSTPPPPSPPTATPIPPAAIKILAVSSPRLNFCLSRIPGKTVTHAGRHRQSSSSPPLPSPFPLTHPWLLASPHPPTQPPLALLAYPPRPPTTPPFDSPSPEVSLITTIITSSITIITTPSIATITTPTITITIPIIPITTPIITTITTRIITTITTPIIITITTPNITIHTTPSTTTHTTPTFTTTIHYLLQHDHTHIRKEHTLSITINHPIRIRQKQDLIITITGTR
ncbi:hypothetical protein C7M84_004995 [Penaeus vannamei]|uniref:Uncharacterized protein n=1 Tax=Penaeus vannamei TaxID=6689 RepID=A0A423TIZ0_PENVA|nr:hypothetical protein C7M84_004995 [Penaeus vannamei]